MVATAPSARRPMHDVVTEEIRVLLVRRHLRAGDLAPVLGTTQQTISNKMTGIRRWSLEDVRTLADFFNVDANTLLPGLGGGTQGPDQDGPGNSGNPTSAWGDLLELRARSSDTQLVHSAA